jgi:two-component system, OmpR family, sensor histidine kinase PhoQ
MQVRAALSSPPSLSRRLALVAAFVLAGFLGLTGSVLDRAFRVSVEDAVREKLQVQIYLLLSAADLDRTGLLRMPDVLPEPKLSSPASGLYAAIAQPGGLAIWQSLSVAGRKIQYPTAGEGGEPAFGLVEAGDVYALTYPVTWELANGGERSLEFRVAETRAAADARVGRFRRSLWTWIGLAALALLAVQAVVLRWGLAPLRRLAGEIRDIEGGARVRLGEAYPRELLAVTRNLNALLASGDARLQRYRDSLADLAHSLKTPLAVLRSVADDRLPKEQRAMVIEQVERMDQAIAYHLQRGAAAGRTLLSTAVDPREALGRIGASLSKVYAAKSVALDVVVEPGTTFLGDPGDLIEILGNLLDNAFKWSREQVRVRVRSIEAGDAARRRLIVEVEDDGPGIPERHRRRVLERGGRADELVPGQGIGLALVRDMVEKAYGGSIVLDTSPLGGALVRVLV